MALNKYQLQYRDIYRAFITQVEDPQQPEHRDPSLLVQSAYTMIQEIRKVQRLERKERENAHYRT